MKATVIQSINAHDAKSALNDYKTVSNWLLSFNDLLTLLLCFFLTTVSFGANKLKQNHEIPSEINNPALVEANTEEKSKLGTTIAFKNTEEEVYLTQSDFYRASAMLTPRALRELKVTLSAQDNKEKLQISQLLLVACAEQSLSLSKQRLLNLRSQIFDILPELTQIELVDLGTDCSTLQQSHADCVAHIGLTFNKS